MKIELLKNTNQEIIYFVFPNRDKAFIRNYELIMNGTQIVKRKYELNIRELKTLYDLGIIE